MGFLAGLPLIGPILQIITGPIASVFNKFFDKQITQIQADASVDQAAIQNQRDMSQDRLALRIMQDALLVPPIVWTDIYIWDQIVAKTHPDWVWPILGWPQEISYLPYMAAVYLLGATGLVLWKRK